MNELLLKLREQWDGLNDRERRLLAICGVVVAVFVLGFPLMWIASQNSDIADENAELRELLTTLAEEGTDLKYRAQARKASRTRYKNKTPPLGSFLEGEAGKHSLKIQEVTDQPEKTTGNYLRRNVRASISDVDLTGAMNLVSGLVSSPYPVAIEHLQLEHFQPGDKYRLRLGVLTFDRTKAKSKDKDEDKGEGDRG
ncbi:MAG: type II secretion system protein M [Myxococcales bacterium]|nr:type II secretion system protein M [Myxococcales bacterium]